MTLKPMLRVEVCTRALRASQNVKKICVPCVFALLKRVHRRIFLGCIRPVVGVGEEEQLMLDATEYMTNSSRPYANVSGSNFLW